MFLIFLWIFSFKAAFSAPFEDGHIQDYLNFLKVFYKLDSNYKSSLNVQFRFIGGRSCLSNSEGSELFYLHHVKQFDFKLNDFVEEFEFSPREIKAIAKYCGSIKEDLLSKSSIKVLENILISRKILRIQKFLKNNPKVNWVYEGVLKNKESFYCFGNHYLSAAEANHAMELFVLFFDLDLSLVRVLHQNSSIFSICVNSEGLDLVDMEIERKINFFSSNFYSHKTYSLAHRANVLELLTKMNQWIQQWSWALGQVAYVREVSTSVNYVYFGILDSLELAENFQENFLKVSGISDPSFLWVEVRDSNYYLVVLDFKEFERICSSIMGQ